MPVDHVEFLVEEPSMGEFLRGFLPGSLGTLSFSIHPFQGKTDLLKQLPARLRGYRQWLPENYRIVVIVDRDDDDCRDLKQRLEQCAVQSGLSSRSNPRDGRFTVVNRIAIEELEAWYFGDWEAVRSAYPRVARHVRSHSNYRNPDAVQGGTWEAFERVLRNAGYMHGGLRKIEAARAISLHIVPERSSSMSFQVFHQALREFVPG